MSGVRYVLTAVLPRYTMRRPNLAAPPARAPRLEAETVERIAAEHLRIATKLRSRNRRVMGHDE